MTKSVTNNETPIAWHNSPALKLRVLAQIQQHQEADHIAPGVYYETVDGKLRVCAVGCVLHDPRGGHEQYETELGLPIVLAYLQDTIFETLDREQENTTWPYRLMAAIAPGADLSSIWPRFANWLLTDPVHGLAHVTREDDIAAVCVQVAAAYQRVIDGDCLTVDDEKLVTEAVRAVQRWDWYAQNGQGVLSAWAVRRAWDARAVRRAWDNRGARDALAARAAWAAWDDPVVREEFVVAGADELIRLLESAPQHPAERLR